MKPSSDCVLAAICKPEVKLSFRQLKFWISYQIQIGYSGPEHLRLYMFDLAKDDESFSASAEKYTLFTEWMHDVEFQVIFDLLHSGYMPTGLEKILCKRKKIEEAILIYYVEAKKYWINNRPAQDVVIAVEVV